MSNPTNRVPEYIQERINGLPPLEAALAAGYSLSSVKVTASRLEKREDVRVALRKAKKGGVTIKTAKGKTVTNDEPEVSDHLKPWELKAKYNSPLELLLDVMNNPKAPSGLRIQCGKDALPYCHARKEGGKKQERDDAAKTVAKQSKFATPAAPSHLRRAA